MLDLDEEVCGGVLLGECWVFFVQAGSQFAHVLLAVGASEAGSLEDCPQQLCELSQALLSVWAWAGWCTWNAGTGGGPGRVGLSRCRGGRSEGVEWWRGRCAALADFGQPGFQLPFQSEVKGFLFGKWSVAGGCSWLVRRPWHRACPRRAPRGSTIARGGWVDGVRRGGRKTNRGGGRKHLF